MSIFARSTELFQLMFSPLRVHWQDEHAPQCIPAKCVCSTLQNELGTELDEALAWIALCFLTTEKKNFVLFLKVKFYTGM